MKKLINSAESVLADALRGVAAAHPELTVDHENRVVISNAPREGRVALISGGHARCRVRGRGVHLADA